LVVTYRVRDVRLTTDGLSERVRPVVRLLPVPMFARTFTESERDAPDGEVAVEAWFCDEVPELLCARAPKARALEATRATTKRFMCFLQKDKFLPEVQNSGVI
jgi:hypothetical protein